MFELETGTTCRSEDGRKTVGQIGQNSSTWEPESRKKPGKERPGSRRWRRSPYLGVGERSRASRTATGPFDRDTVPVTKPKLERRWFPIPPLTDVKLQCCYGASDSRGNYRCPFFYLFTHPRYSPGAEKVHCTGAGHSQVVTQSSQLPSFLAYSVTTFEWKKNKELLPVWIERLGARKYTRAVTGASCKTGAKRWEQIFSFLFARKRK
jgi:hypothetical protein